jgi:hypothetical protein
VGLPDDEVTEGLLSEKENAMNARWSTQMKAREGKAEAFLPGNLLQRKCACGTHTIAGDACESCRRKETSDQLQRAAANAEAVNEAPPVVHEVLRSSGQPLDASTRGLMEPRFRHDFSHVRVHTGGRAAESAQAVNALAYTVNEHIVFQEGQYNPASLPGQQLLAHELTHVLQQRPEQARAHAPAAEETSTHTRQPTSNVQTKLQIGAPGDRSEQEADRTARNVMESGTEAQAIGLATTTRPAAIQMQPAPPQPQPQVVPPVAPNAAQQKIIDDARRAASIRTQTALMRLRGIVPAGPPGSAPEQQMRLRARRLAQVMFQWADPNMEQIEEVVSKMVSHLASAPVMIAGKNDPECGSRGAYVRGLQPPIVVCPSFFNDTEQQIRTMIHEAAHLARIGSASLGESYCVVFDCATACGGFDSADSWAHFIHCLSGQTADKPTVIQGQPGGTPPPAGGQKPGGGGTP